MYIKKYISRLIEDAQKYSRVSKVWEYLLIQGFFFFLSLQFFTLWEMLKTLKLRNNTYGAYVYKNIHHILDSSKRPPFTLKSLHIIGIYCMNHLTYMSKIKHPGTCLSQCFSIFFSKCHCRLLILIIITIVFRYGSSKYMFNIKKGFIY